MVAVVLVLFKCFSGLLMCHSLLCFIVWLVFCGCLGCGFAYLRCVFFLVCVVVCFRLATLFVCGC